MAQSNRNTDTAVNLLKLAISESMGGIIYAEFISRIYISNEGDVYIPNYRMIDSDALRYIIFNRFIRDDIINRIMTDDIKGLFGDVYGMYAINNIMNKMVSNTAPIIDESLSIIHDTIVGKISVGELYVDYSNESSMDIIIQTEHFDYIYQGVIASLKYNISKIYKSAKVQIKHVHKDVFSMTNDETLIINHNNSISPLYVNRKTLKSDIISDCIVKVSGVNFIKEDNIININAPKNVICNIIC